MDSITQGLLGAASAQLGFRQRIGRDATLVAFGAGAAADLDTFVGPLLSMTGAEVDEFTIMQIHRGPSHSLLLAPLLALPIALVWWHFRRRLVRGDEPPPPAADTVTHPEVARQAQAVSDRPRPPGFLLLYACVLVAFLTHAPLDYLTAYGTQIFSPWTNARYALDAVAIIDFIFTPLLVLTLTACYLVRKARGGRAPRATLVIGWVGFLLAMGYLAAGKVLHDRAVDVAAGAVNSEKVLRVDAYPQIGSIFLWRAVVETEDHWVAVRVHHFSKDPPAPGEIRSRRKQPVNRWVRRAQELREYQVYEWFSRGRLRTEYRNLNGVHLVRFHDMRYSWESDGVESLWPLLVEFDDEGRLITASRQSPQRQEDTRSTAADIWSDLWNP
jgi:inner membrane protein